MLEPMKQCATVKSLVKLMRGWCCWFFERIRCCALLPSMGISTCDQVSRAIDARARSDDKRFVCFNHCLNKVRNLLAENGAQKQNPDYIRKLNERHSDWNEGGLVSILARSGLRSMNGTGKAHKIEKICSESAFPIGAPWIGGSQMWLAALLFRM